MKSFKRVIMSSIKRKTYTREYYEETVANWLMHNWLTDDEATEIINFLDEIFPIEETEDEIIESEKTETKKESSK